jgi:hypothetical protein
MRSSLPRAPPGVLAGEQTISRAGAEGQQVRAESGEGGGQEAKDTRLLPHAAPFGRCSCAGTLGMVLPEGRSSQMPVGLGAGRATLKGPRKARRQ